MLELMTSSTIAFVTPQNTYTLSGPETSRSAHALTKVLVSTQKFSIWQIQPVFPAIENLRVKTIPLAIFARIRDVSGLPRHLVPKQSFSPLHERSFKFCKRAWVCCIPLLFRVRRQMNKLIQIFILAKY